MEMGGGGGYFISVRSREKEIKQRALNFSSFFCQSNVMVVKECERGKTERKELCKNNKINNGLNIKKNQDDEISKNIFFSIFIFIFIYDSMYYVYLRYQCVSILISWCGVVCTKILLYGRVFVFFVFYFLKWCLACKNLVCGAVSVSISSHLLFVSLTNFLF